MPQLQPVPTSLWLLELLSSSARIQPTEVHLTAAKRIFHYLKGTTDLGLRYRNRQMGNFQGRYSDSDWAGDPDNQLLGIYS